MQVESAVQEVFLQNPAEQVIAEGQSEAVVQEELHCGTGEGLGLGDGLGLAEAVLVGVGVTVAISKVNEQLDGGTVAAAGLLVGAFGVIVPCLV